MKNLKIVLLLLVNCFIFAQELTKEQIELSKPYIFKVNKEIFNQTIYESQVDTNFVAPWLSKNKIENVKKLVNEIASNYKLQVIELSFNKQKEQAINLKVKFKNSIDNQNQFKIEIASYNLEDEKGNKLKLKNIVGLSQGGSNNNEYSENDINFYLENSAEKKISGKIKFKISGLTSYKETLINKFPKVSTFTFKNSNYKIIEQGNNFIKFKGFDSLANSRVESIKYLNLDKNLKKINRKLKVQDFSITQFNDNSSTTQNTNFGSNRVSLSEMFFDEKISRMSFEEYSKFLDDNINTGIILKNGW